jgi:PAS domain S-box-containing protein
MHTKFSILAIDDTPTNLFTLGSALSSEFDLQIATSGPEGLRLAQETPPDIILLDVMMPEMDGYEVCRRLKDNPQLCTIPVIFVTALDDDKSEVNGLALGAADYLTKPINVEIARRRIRNLLEREQLRREVEVQRDQLAEQLENLRKLQTAVEQSPASIVITDLAANIEYVNPRFTAITGYAPAEVIGQNPRILQSGQTDKLIYKNLWDGLAEGQAWHGELLNKRKNGETYWEEAQIAPVKNAQGEMTHYVAVKNDITRRKQLELANEELLQRLQKIASHVPGVVYQYRRRPDGSSCFPFASEAIRQIYRVGPEDVEHDATVVFERIHPDDCAAVRVSINQSAENLTPWRQEYRVKFADEVRWLYGNALPEREADGATLWHGFITDISERKLVEAELEQYRHHLEAMVEARTNDLSIAKENAEAANRAKTTFLANMSHELRTPLNGIIGMTGLALRRSTDEKQIDYLGKVDRSAKNLLAIISDVLDIAKIEAERLHLESVDFRQMSIGRRALAGGAAVLPACG